MRKKILMTLTCLLVISFITTLLIQKHYTKDYYYQHKVKMLVNYLDTIEGSMESIKVDEAEKINIIGDLFINYRTLPALYITKDNEVVNIMDSYLKTDGLLNEVRKQYIIDENLLKKEIMSWSQTITTPDYTTIEVANQSILVVCYPNKAGDKLISIQFNHSIEEFFAKSYAFLVISSFSITTILFLFCFVISTKVRNVLIDFTRKVEDIRNMNFVKFDIKKGPKEIKNLKLALNLTFDKLKDTIHELNRTNRELEKELQYKTRIEEQRKRFVSDVSHELKTPIAIIQSYSEAIIDDVGDKDFYIKAIFDEANNMEYLVTALLELSKMDSGIVQLELEQINVEEVLQKEVKILDHLIEEYGTRVIIRTSEPHFIKVDVNKFGQVIRNLIINGLQYGKKHEAIIIDLLKTKEGYVELSFYNQCDDLISEEQVNSLFDRFYKVDLSRQRGKSGAGLGLSIVKDIVSLHGGYCKAQLKREGIAIIIAFKQ